MFFRDPPNSDIGCPLNDTIVAPTAPDVCLAFIRATVDVCVTASFPADVVAKTAEAGCESKSHWPQEATLAVSVLPQISLSP